MPLKSRQGFSLSHLPVELRADSCVYGVYQSARHPDQCYTLFFHPCFPKTFHSCENPSLFSHKLYISSDLGREFEKISNQQTHKVTTLTTHNSSLPWLCSPAAIFQCLLLHGQVTAYHVWIILKSLSLPEFIRKET